MNQATIITHGDQAINQSICNQLLDQGYKVHLLFDDQTNADEYFNSIQEPLKAHYHAIIKRIDDPKSIREVLDKSIEKMDGLDLFIHGNEWLNEEECYERNVEALGIEISSQFQSLYAWNHHVGIHMAKQRKGKIVFPLLNDTLYYLGYPSSPMLNHGKISMMKCLARELAPFEIEVNAITFGYYDRLGDREARKKLRKQLEIYVLKPPVPKLEQLITSLQLLLQRTEYMISGQNIQLGAGMDTSI